MSEVEARELRAEIEQRVPEAWVAGFRIVGGKRWQLEVRDWHRKGMPWFVIHSRAQAARKWPALARSA